MFPNLFSSVLFAAGFITQTAVAAPGDDPAAIMAKAAANIEKAADSRRQFVYRQFIVSSLVRSNGKIARKENREYEVFPTESNTEKKLVSLRGEVRRGKKITPYTEAGFKDKSFDIDGDLIREMTDELVNAKDSRDGIPPSLFPLRTADLPGYRFTLLEEPEYQGRRTYRIRFEPAVKRTCINIGGDDDECDGPSWKGEAWIDCAELQPVRIFTEQAFHIPWAMKVFLGTNIQQSGFAISYQRVAADVWFPVSYGTEFRLNVLFGYKRTITLSLVSNGFRKTDVSSKIKYAASKDP